MTANELQQMHDAGQSYNAIARALNAAGVPTPSGRGQWHRASVKRTIDPVAWARYIQRHRQELRNNPTTRRRNNVSLRAEPE